MTFRATQCYCSYSVDIWLAKDSDDPDKKPIIVTTTRRYDNLSFVTFRSAIESTIS